MKARARFIKKEKIMKKEIGINFITLFLLLLWVPVTVDKLWNLSFFHKTLLQQPFPNWWADLLFWLLPLAELVVVVLLIWPKKKFLHIGMWLYFILLIIFTLYIALGVAGFYAQKPCGCGSIVKGLSWSQHLIVNLFFLFTSIGGIFLINTAKQ
jgi:hypothetical protein